MTGVVLRRLPLMEKTGFVLVLKVLEKRWNLILGFRGAWKALRKKDLVGNCLKTPWIFAWVKLLRLHHAKTLKRQFKN